MTRAHRGGRFEVSVVLVIILVGTLWASTRAMAAEDLATVSIVELLANPDKWDGHVVRVVGYSSPGLDAPEGRRT